MKFNSLILFLLLCASGTLDAQKPRCSSTTTARNQEYHEGTPRGGAITISVVVHIVWHEDDELISEAQVHSQIAVLNEDFRKLNADITDVLPGGIQGFPGGYVGEPADMNINFVLADTDLDGNPHNGIVEVHSPHAISYNEMQNGKRSLCYDELGGSSAWCTSCFLNIWVTNLPNAAGVGIFPTQVEEGEVSPEEDGLYIAYDRFGTIGLTPPYHLGRTVTHEAGHYFNLYHLWGPGQLPNNCSPAECCEDDVHHDFVDDTNRQNQTFQDECPTGGQQTCDSRDNFQNFMCYSDDACLLMFTEGQKTRVWQAINTFRAGFLSENCLTEMGCIVSTTPDLIETGLESVFYTNEQLHFRLERKNLEITLFDLQGRTLHQSNYEAPGNYRINVNKLAAGVYFVNASGQKYSATKKIVILR